MCMLAENWIKLCVSLGNTVVQLSEVYHIYFFLYLHLTLFHLHLYSIFTMHNLILSMHVHRRFGGRLLELTPQKKPGLPGSKLSSRRLLF